VQGVLGGRAPDATTIRQLVYVRQVINETLRIYPPTFWLGRQAVSACELGGVSLPAGGLICISPYVTHRHPEFWTAPDRFDPDRFGPEAMAGRPRGAYFPFGLGPRHCIGQHLALLEMTVVVAMVTGRWNLVLTEDPHPQPRLQGTLQPSTPIWAYLTSTSPSDATEVRAASA
jgi:cytochrome P450